MCNVKYNTITQLVQVDMRSYISIYEICTNNPLLINTSSHIQFPSILYMLFHHPVRIFARPLTVVNFQVCLQIHLGKFKSLVMSIITARNCIFLSGSSSFNLWRRYTTLQHSYLFFFNIRTLYYCPKQVDDIDELSISPVHQELWTFGLWDIFYISIFLN